MYFTFIHKKVVAPKHVTKYTAFSVCVCVCVYTQIYIFVSPPTTVLESEINNAFFGVFETAQSDGSLLYPPAPPQPTLEKKKKKGRQMKMEKENDPTIIKSSINFKI